jgi:hypothetical protein
MGPSRTLQSTSPNIVADTSKWRVSGKDRNSVKPRHGYINGDPAPVARRGFINDVRPHEFSFGKLDLSTDASGRLNSPTGSSSRSPAMNIDPTEMNNFRERAKALSEMDKRNMSVPGQIDQKKYKRNMSVPGQIDQKKYKGMLGSLPIHPPTAHMGAYVASGGLATLRANEVVAPKENFDSASGGNGSMKVEISFKGAAEEYLEVAKEFAHGVASGV